MTRLLVMRRCSDVFIGHAEHRLLESPSGTTTCTTSTLLDGAEGCEGLGSGLEALFPPTLQHARAGSGVRAPCCSQRRRPSTARARVTAPRFAAQTSRGARQSLHPCSETRFRQPPSSRRGASTVATQVPAGRCLCREIVLTSLGNLPTRYMI